MDESKILEKLESALGEKYNPLLCKARNAIALQVLTDKQMARTIKNDGSIVIAKEQQKLVSLIASSNAAMDGLVKYLVKSKGDTLSELLEAMQQATTPRQASLESEVAGDE